MEAKSLGPSSPPALAIDPQTRILQKQAEEDRLTAIQDRLSQETRSNLIRYGRQRAFAGGGPSSSPSLNLGPTFGRGL